MQKIMRKKKKRPDCNSSKKKEVHREEKNKRKLLTSVIQIQKASLGGQRERKKDRNTVQKEKRRHKNVCLRQKPGNRRRGSLGKITKETLQKRDWEKGPNGSVGKRPTTVITGRRHRKKGGKEQKKKPGKSQWVKGIADYASTPLKRSGSRSRRSKRT